MPSRGWAALRRTRVAPNLSNSCPSAEAGQLHGTPSAMPVALRPSDSRLSIHPPTGGHWRPNVYQPSVHACIALSSERFCVCPQAGRAVGAVSGGHGRGRPHQAPPADCHALQRHHASAHQAQGGPQQNAGSHGCHAGQDTWSLFGSHAQDPRSECPQSLNHLRAHPQRARAPELG
jgi:hypothetical protein